MHEHTLTLFGISPSEAKDPVVSPGFAAAGFKGRALRFGGPENGLNPVFIFTGCLNNQTRNTVNISKSKNDFLAARIDQFSYVSRSSKPITHIEEAFEDGSLFEAERMEENDPKGRSGAGAEA